MNHPHRCCACRQISRGRGGTWLLRIFIFLAAIISLPDLSSVVMAAPRAGSAAQPVSYVVDLRTPNIHLVGVTMSVPEAKPGTRIQFPTWTALYQIRDFVRNMVNLQARCDGAQFQLSRLDMNTWATGNESCRTLEVSYAVYVAEASVFSSELDTEHAYLNLAMVLFYLPQERDRAVRILFYNMPKWNLATLLPGPDEEGWHAARNYDELVDSPVEAGQFQEYRYEQKGAEYRIVVHANPRVYDAKRLLESVKKITAAGTGLMGDVPYSRFTFIYHFQGEGGGGGMEHRDGTAITIVGNNPSGNWQVFESTTAHEFMHVWNVKRIRPQGLEPVDYVHGNDTSELWLCEGVSTTLAEYALLRAGLTSRKALYARIAAEINNLHARPARRIQSVEEAGREAWLEKYPDYLRPERSISYYNKGEIVGFLLDLAIRHATGSQRSLDDFFRRLNEDFAKRGRFYTRQDLLRILQELAPVGCDFQEFFRENVSGTEELDYATYLGYAGLKLNRELGEKPKLGFTAVQNFNGPIIVQSLEPESRAERAGLESGDILLEMDGQPLNSPPQSLRKGLTPGREVRFRIRRGQEEKDVRFRIDSAVGTTYSIEEDKKATDAQRTLRNHWLNGTTIPSAGVKKQ